MSVKDVVFRGEEGSFSTKAVPDGMVDLGLSVCWASANVGATSPQEAGTFYSWADANALGLTLPTREQMEELRKGCNWTWAIVDNVQGYLVQGKSTGNSIFLPAVGAVYWDNPAAGDSGFWSCESRLASDGIRRGYYLRYNSSLVSVDDVNVNSYKFPVRVISD